MFNVNQRLATLLTLALMGARYAAQVNGNCGECQANGVACLDEEHFATCFQNTPATNRLPCPQGNVCTAEPQICLPATQGHAAACRADVCGSCTATADRFACLDETRYGFCYTATQPNAATIRVCPAGYVCNVKSLQICEEAQSAVPSCLSAIVTTTTGDPSTASTPGDTTNTATADTPSANTVTDTGPESAIITTTQSTVTTTTTESTVITATEPVVITTTESTVITATESAVITATESTVTPTTTVVIPVIDSTPAAPPTDAPTTTPVPRQPNTLCADIGQKGNFKPDADSTCQRYIKCYVLSGQFVGWEYTCSPGYFSQTLGDCQSAKPATC